MALLSFRAYARHRGISHTAVEKAVKQGRIQVDANGKIDAEQADRDWDHNTSQVNAPTTSRPLEATGGASYAQSRAVRELYLAKIAKIEFEQKAAKLVSRDEVTVVAFTKARTIRDNLLNIPDRLAAMLAAERDPARVHELLSDEIRKVLNELSGNHRG